MTKCCIKGCDSNAVSKTETLSFFNFPRINDRRHKTWVENIGAENIIISTVQTYICSKHFEPDMINRTLTKSRLQEDAIPTIFPFILTAAELSNNSTPQITKDEPRKALTMVIDTGILKGVVPEQTNTTKASPLYQVHLHVPRDPDNKNTSPPINPLTSMPKVMAQKRQLSSISTDVDEGVIPRNKNNLTHSSLRASKIQQLSKLVLTQRQKIRALTRAKNRLQKKIITFKNVIVELKTNSELSKEHTILAEESEKYLTRQMSKWERQKKV